MNKQEQELRKKSPVQIRNKKASFEYFFVDTYTAGIVLTGTEIKSIRGGKASLVDCYCDFYNGELWAKGMNISPYFYGSFGNHEARRDRKLLLNKRELRRLEEDAKQPGVQHIIIAFHLSGHVGKPLSPEVFLSKIVFLYLRAHGTIENQYFPVTLLFQSVDMPHI